MIAEPLGEAPFEIVASEPGSDTLPRTIYGADIPNMDRPQNLGLGSLSPFEFSRPISLRLRKRFGPRRLRPSPPSCNAYVLKL